LPVLAMRRLKQLFIAGLLTAILIGYVGPVRAYLDQRAELGRQQAALVELETKRERLERQNAALDRPAVLEAKARALGLIKPDERAYVVRGLPDERPPREASDDGGGIWGWLAGHL
jgi:cell division protein FtsB